jgi:hypothetical protein
VGQPSSPVEWQPPGWQSAGKQQVHVGQPKLSVALPRPHIPPHVSAGQLVVGVPLHSHDKRQPCASTL